MSSPFGARGFCRDCGTPLSFHYVDSPNIDLAVGALDDPGAVRLTSHFGVESRLHGWTGGQGLSEMRSEDHKPLQERWAKVHRSEEHTSELQSLMRISYAVFCLKKKKNIYIDTNRTTRQVNKK